MPFAVTLNSVRRALPAAAIACLFAYPALAQTWTERPYNPAIGSRWTISEQTDSEDFRETEHRTEQVKSRAELTIEEKLPDGFRVTYVIRDIGVTGNAPAVELMNASVGAMKGITIRARTDAAGKPVAVENIDEVKATMRVVVARMVSAFQDKPKVAEMMGQMLNGLLVDDGADAARTYMENLPLLAVGQNTGLKPGDVRRENESVQSPLGGAPIKSVLITRLASWDNAAGTARIVRKREMDIEAMRAVTIKLARKIVAATDDKASAQMVEMMKQINFSIDSEATIDVRDGMARVIDDRSTTTASVMGHTFRKIEKKVVTVEPLAN